MSRFNAELLARARQAIQPEEPPAQQPDEAIDLVLALCRRFEGYYAQPYLCPAGVPTIGYGATAYLDGRPVTLKDPPLSPAAAERLLRVSIERHYLPQVQRMCPAARQPGQVAALVDFTFNLGPGRLASSTLRRKVNAGEWADVPAELRKWVVGGGRVLRGLVTRREAEIALL